MTFHSNWRFTLFAGAAVRSRQELQRPHEAPVRQRGRPRYFRLGILGVDDGGADAVADGHYERADQPSDNNAEDLSGTGF